MRFIKITSPANPLIKETLKIKEKRMRYRHEAFLIEGQHLLEAALAASSVEIKRVFFTEGFLSKKEGQRLLRQISKRDIQLIETSKHILSRLADTETPQGIIATVSIKPIGLEEIRFRDVPSLAICDGIQDPGNLGAIIRISDVAGADAVIILPGTCDVFMPKTIRATAGSLFNIPIVYSEIDALIGYLRDRNIRLYSSDAHAKALIYESDFRQPVAIAFGNEAHGVSEPMLKNAAAVFKIPIIGKAESLNVAMAASICLYEVVRQRSD
ncbi:MAG: RNA methyltransferase [Thermodesulfovibrionales bacterium]|nr:RNA methyltransferase [Thermodesulfovibrionales bacterium]